ncbi:MAG: GGDEF domain-containing protein, partial [Candidatus Obscuribacterales bacterium]|nr:GGDEF domain-containing protein [Candidatus Obscuribacterales bacterium]
TNTTGAHKTSDELREHSYIIGAEEALRGKDTTEMERLALLDSITGLYNQQAISKILRTEVKRAKRYKRPVAIIFVEPDQFDEVSSRGGNLAAEALLRGLSEMLLKTFRDVDVPARYTSTRFMVVCPETNAHGAAIISERLRERVANDYMIEIDQNWYVTVSVSYAAFPKHALSVEELLERSEQALMRAQSAGGDRCEPA